MQIKVPGGSFTGAIEGEIVRFRNVPYGILKARFTEAEMANNVGDCDCTRQGPLCPQDKPYRDSYLSVAEEDVIEFEEVYDEMNCLNLMITMPKSVGTAKLPVVVWVHGGGNSAGTAYRGVNDPKDWVQRGIDIGKPFIVVTIQYRVHFFGFLPFKGKGNFGQYDQLLATDWVHKYIGYFGGDKDRVTVAGQSSGSFCVWNVSCRPDAKFKQAAYLSGSLKGTSTRSLEEYEELTKKICNLLNCTEDELQTCPWHDLVRAYKELGIQVLMQCDDGHFKPKGEWHKPPQNMHRVIISDCIEDGQFFTDGLQEGQLVGMLQQLIPESVQKVYPLKTDHQAIRLLTDYIFAAGNHSVDCEMQQTIKVFRQLFDATNPVDPSRGNIHMVELLYLLHAYKVKPEYLPLVHRVQDLWIDLIYYEDPWDPKQEFLRVESTTVVEPRENLSKYRAIDKFHVLDNEVVRKSRNTISGW
ncbi:Lipase 3 [Wickerhamiella sorbophila]|uniref:Carboxylic ester hydrolase n=1 Tax=Wickerhamiella sorbophila TaxID=45607 RepID=A0A2T0FGA4_9ASCO|nr:Lipase 3 [Wickerhamiella sorbophila]PRT54032.1 Lipase 3 [Wickerhamiella sorbophila]